MHTRDIHEWTDGMRTFVFPVQCSNCPKTARGSSAVGGQEVESRHARCMWDWEGTLLDASVGLGGGSALSSKILNFRF